METVVRTQQASLKAPIKDGTASSAQLRVRRRSLKLYRMSLATLEGYFKEIVRQKRLRSEDIELAGIFLIPGAGVQNLAVDVDQRLLFYRFSLDAGRGVALRTMIVAKDKSTGTLHAVFDQRGGQMKG